MVSTVTPSGVVCGANSRHYPRVRSEELAMSACIGTSSVAENISTERRVATEPLTCRNHIVQVPANCRSFAIALTMHSLSFQRLTNGAPIAISCATTTREQMLRITRKANGEVVFKVSGQINAENVAEIGTLIEAEKNGRRIVLDQRSNFRHVF